MTTEFFADIMGEDVAFTVDQDGDVLDVCKVQRPPSQLLHDAGVGDELFRQRVRKSSHGKVAEADGVSWGIQPLRGHQ